MFRRHAAVSVGALLLFSLGCDREPEAARSSNPNTKPSATPSASPPVDRAESSSAGAEPTEAGASHKLASPDFVRPEGLGPLDPELRSRPVAAQQDYLLRLLVAREKPNSEALQTLVRVVHGSEWLSFGNPKIAEPALSQAECHALWQESLPLAADPSCGHRNMVHASARVCIDQFEFPNVLCEYPVVWTRASEAAEICGALGKRLCDAHEWEGACAGSVAPPEEEYFYGRLPKGQGAEYRRARRILMEGWHNLGRPLVWAYGATKNHALCATGSKKSKNCSDVSYGECGTNDYPAGSFPDCRTPSGVYDQHGNVAEHMSLPLFDDELGGQGYTEMKGSWFLFAREETHPDDCRWRARNWHTTKISDPNSHRNYHLGFRCCADTNGPG
jgi:formylglycine-generating enzyme